VRRVLLTRQAVAIGGAAVMGLLSFPAIASAASHAPRPAAPVPPAAQSRPALPPGQHYACGAVPIGRMACMAIFKTAAGAGFAAMAGSPSAQAALTPGDLRRAYKLTKISPNKGKGRLVAIVDAFSNPRLEADLKVYRSHFHLPPCTTANGCLRILNQRGKSKPLPPARAGWGLEESLDLDMVSAICPRCHITLIEAANSADTNLGTAEQRAIASGARYVSNSWGNFEFAAENSFSHYFNHPGHVIDFAAGDLGYGPTFPAALQYVTSVGGTSLRRTATRRGWTESVWGTRNNSPKEGTNSGCSALLPKPSWQRVDVGFTGACIRRTENDVSAVANPSTGVLVYDTYHFPGPIEVGGTSASAPIVTAIYALAGVPVRNTYPAEYMYLKSSHLFDVTSGVNGICPGQTYLCHGLPGYDGPTGLGTPNGTAAFTIRRATRVTLIDPGDRRISTGHRASIKIVGLDSRNASRLAYHMTAVPGLKITSIPRSTNAMISGTPTTLGTYNVTVTAKDGAVKGTTHFQIKVV